MTLADAKDLATVAGVCVAIFAFIKGLIEYIHQGAQKRAEKYFDFENRFLENDEFKKICELLENDDPALAKVTYQEKLHFLGFYEQVALMLNSKLLRREVAHYMFGYYAVRCLDSKHFWKDAEKESPYWSLFISFATEMKSLENGFRLDRKRLRF